MLLDKKDIIKMEKFLEYLKNQKRIGIENGALQSDIDLLKNLIKEAEKQCDINGVSKSFTASEVADMLVKYFSTIEEAIAYFDKIE